MRELAVSRRSPYIQAFIWLWGTEKLNICRLFWGTVLFPLGLIFGSEKPIRGFIPRPSLIFLVASAIELGTGHIPQAVALFASCPVAAYLGYRHRRLGKRSIESRVSAFGDFVLESPAPSARRTRVGLAVAFSPVWVPFFLIFKVIDGVIELVKPDRPVKEETGGRTKKIGIGGVLVQEFKSFKQRTCLRVKLI